MKKVFSITLIVFLTLALFACGGNGGGGEVGGDDVDIDDNGDMPVVTIGVFQPQSGDNGAGGKQELLGTLYAHSVEPTVEIDGVEYEVKLEIVDNQSSPAYAPTAAQQLISRGSALILGSYGSAVCIAASDVFKDAGLPAIGITCTNPAVTLDNDHYFRICFLDPFQGTVLANFARDEFKAEKAYVLAKLGDDYSVGLARYFMDAFGEENCRYETFPEGTSDYSTYVDNAITYGAGVFFSPVSTEAAALIIDQAVTKNLEAPILAGDTWDSNVILNAAEGKEVQIYVTTFYQEGAAPQFDSGFRTFINSDPANLAMNGGDDKIAAVSAMGYDGYFVALEALRQAGTTDSGVILDILWDVTWNGASGPIAFDDVGDAKRSTAIVKWCNPDTGEWEFFAEQGVI